MEGMLSFVGIIIIVFGVLQIILFFKLWGMTNNISRIKDLLEARLKSTQTVSEGQANRGQAPGNNQNNEPSPNDICKGDTVIRLSDGKKMTVDSIENGQYFCKVSMLEGYKYFNREEISL